MNEKIKEIAVFDGFKAPPKGCANPVWHNKDRNHVVRDEDMRSYYLTDLNSLHRVALDLMDKVSSENMIHRLHNAMLFRPINGQYTALVDAVYDAIVYLKKQELCQPK